MLTHEIVFCHANMKSSYVVKLLTILEMLIKSLKKVPYSSKFSCDYNFHEKLQNRIFVSFIS